MAANLCSNLIVRKTGSREEWNLLPSSDSVHDVNGGDASLDHLLGVGAFRGVNGGSADVQPVLRNDRGAEREKDKRMWKDVIAIACFTLHYKKGKARRRGPDVEE